MVALWGTHTSLTSKLTHAINRDQGKNKITFISILHNVIFLILQMQTK